MKRLPPASLLIVHNAFVLVTFLQFIEKLHKSERFVRFIMLC